MARLAHPGAEHIPSDAMHKIETMIVSNMTRTAKGTYSYCGLLCDANVTAPVKAASISIPVFTPPKAGIKSSAFNFKAFSLMAWFNSTVVHLKWPAARCVSQTRGNTFDSACFILLSKKVLM